MNPQVATAPRRQKGIGRLWREVKKNRSPYLFIAPFFTAFLVFMLYPVLYSFYLSFHRFKRPGVIPYIGIRNYQILLQDPVFWESLKNTVVIGLGYVPIMLFLGLVVAVLLNSQYLKFRTGFRIAYFLPYITSLVVVSLVFSLIYDRNYGILNWALSWVGLGPINWLSDARFAKLSIIILMIWRWTGYNMVLMLAGLQSIPNTLYEAAVIDGASPMQSFFRVTVPMMRPVILFCSVLSTIGTFKMFTEPYILTGGGPVNSSTTVVLYLYQVGFDYLRFGYASTIAYVIFVIVLVLSIIQVKYFGNNDEERA